MRVVHVETTVDVQRPYELGSSEEEDIVAARARIKERRFFGRRAGRDEAHTACGTLTEGPAVFAAAADSQWLVLVDVLDSVAVLRDERIGAVEEQPSTV
jgi:hypothetical protein